MLFSLMVSSSPCGRATSGSGVPELVVAGTGAVVRFIGRPSLWVDSPAGLRRVRGCLTAKPTMRRSPDLQKTNVDGDQLGGIGHAQVVKVPRQARSFTRHVVNSPRGMMSTWRPIVAAT